MEMSRTAVPENAECDVRVTPRWRAIVLFLVFFGVTVLLQFLSGAYRSEFAGYPDESAHYVTGLMVRDYIAGLHYSEPIKFARDYYEHYPKVALGHWPPLLYFFSGIWMLIFSPSRASVLLELAFLTTLLACLTYNAVKRHYGWIAGAMAALLLVCLPIIQVYSDEVMAESLLTLVSFAAAIYFARYLESGRWQDSALFGVSASLAILTKGNGWDLALIPPVAVLLTRNFGVIRKWSFWVPVVIVTVTCAPWQLETMSLVDRGWDGGDQPNMAYTLKALGQLFVGLFDLLGWGLAPLLLIGIAVTVVVPFFRSKVRPEWACLAGLVFAAWIFHAIVPAGVESRKLIIAIPALILFLFAGIEWFAEKLHWNRGVIAFIALAVFAFQKFSIPAEIHYGYSNAASYIQHRPDFQNTVILVSSERDGEGMLVSELAMCDKRPAHTVLRGTKVLASTDWNGNVFETYFRTPEALLNFLRDARVGLVVSDTLPPTISFEHQHVLNQAIARYPDKLKLIATFHGDVKGDVNLYRVN
jgi:Dolichyl-phosphate-mannose-protein mannosyltransferase